MKKWVVWIPGFETPKVIYADKWETITQSSGRTRIIFKIDNRSVGLVTARCAVFEEVDEDDV